MLFSSGYYIRPQGEYRRPDKRLLLPSEPDEFVYVTYPRGVIYEHYERIPLGRIEVELVPEPGNPHDSRALAVDHGDIRIGYVKATLASVLQPRILRLNREGLSVWCCARVRGGEPNDDPAEQEDWDEVDRAYAAAPEVRLYLSRIEAPAWGDQWDQQVHEIRTIWTLLDESIQASVIASGFHLDRDTARAFWEHRDITPHLNWPAGHSDSDDLPPEFQSLLREFRLDHGEALAEKRAAIRAESERLKAIERATATAELLSRDAKIVELAKQGLTCTSIGRQVGLSPTRIRSVIERSGLEVTNSPRGSADREKRWDRGLKALAMQEAGMSRREIADKFGVTAGTMKAILRDARFYRNPEANQGRLAQARRAKLEGWATKNANRIQVPAARDAQMLTQKRPDLMGDGGLS